MLVSRAIDDDGDGVTDRPRQDLARAEVGHLLPLDHVEPERSLLDRASHSDGHCVGGLVVHRYRFHFNAISSTFPPVRRSKSAIACSRRSTSVAGSTPPRASK